MMIDSRIRSLHILLRFFLVFPLLTEREEYKNKPRFLYGESMGGALVLHIHRKEPEAWSGAVLQAPMCKVCFLHAVSIRTYHKKLSTCSWYLTDCFASKVLDNVARAVANLFRFRTK